MQPPTPLDEAQLATLAATRAARRKLRVANFIAGSNVLGLGVCAIFSVASGLMETSLPLVGIALGVLAWNEERGRRQLLAADARAPRRLALNQVTLFIVVLAYCSYQAYSLRMSMTQDVMDVTLSTHPELLEALGEHRFSADDLQWVRTAVLIANGMIAAGSLLVQGLTALYYRSLGPKVEALAAAPAWARELTK